ncbi:ABC transporter substrate-binding protein [Paenibacillus piri]|uniref:Sugar ABC transporter substrate-binding protein n=1 Tax=Paenibacillus piri TaxID=2547395 RepID=A0A4R5KF26_9BACL|nr:sugar ABC transporter substrate-binding protein [Paenibacillus piri]TDF93285.1 sugar ABC transporter substrate-binding protein [Paenibacillus piri]
MRKTTILTAIVTAIAVTASAGCTSEPAAPNTAKDSPAQDAKAKGTVELKFWDMVWGPPEYIEVAKKLVAKFNEENPGIKVSYQSTPWDNWYQTFTTAIASGTAPDVSTGAGYQAFQFYQMGAILPVDDVVDEMKKAGKLDDFYEGTVESLKYDNHYVSMPWALDIRVPFYNKETFEKAGVAVPKTWDELREAAKKLSGSGKYGMVMPSDTGGTHYLFALMLNNGGGMFTADKKVDFMNERNVEAIKFIASMVKDGSINPAGAGFKGDDAVKSFGQGNAAMIIRNPGFKDALPEMKSKIGIIPPIKGPHGETATIRWANNMMVYKQSKHPAEAKKFLTWWLENNTPLWTEGHSNQLPARKTVAKNDYFQKDEHVKFILDHYVPIGTGTGARYPSSFPELNEIEGEGLMQTLTQELIMGKDPTESMKKAETKIKEIMKQK